MIENGRKRPGFKGYLHPRPSGNNGSALRIEWQMELPILIVIRFGNRRFAQLAKEIPKITEKMLSKELRELEANQLVKRTVYASVPVVVEYSLTEYGYSLNIVTKELKIWGMAHRKRIRAINTHTKVVLLAIRMRHCCIHVDSVWLRSLFGRTSMKWPFYRINTEFIQQRFTRR